jgi:cytochrome P450 family 135
MEGTEILRAALTAYNFQAPDPTPEPAKPKNVTLVPARGAEVAVTHR